MPLPKRKFREIVFQLLYSQDITSDSGEHVIPLLMEQLRVSRNTLRDAYQKALEIRQHLPELDQMIVEASKDYDFDQIHRVEKNILRLGFYELYFEKGIPHKVVIAEALRLSKKFSTPEAVKFVNAILDRTLPQEEGEEDKMQIFWNCDDRPE